MNRKQMAVIASVLAAAISLAMMAGGAFQILQQEMAFPMPVQISDVVFSTDDGLSWIPLTDESALENARSSIRFRCHVAEPIADGSVLHLFLQHMQMELRINGSIVGQYARGYEESHPSWCANVWADVELPATTPQDEMELRLYSRHHLESRGKGNVYADTLASMRLGDRLTMYRWGSELNRPERLVGFLLLLAAMLLTGIALASVWMQHTLQRSVLFASLLIFGEGLYWLSGTSEMIRYVSGSVAMFSMGRAMSRTLVAYGLLASAAGRAHGKRRHAVRVISRTSGSFSLVYAVLTLTGLVPLCDAEWVWRAAQMVCIAAGLCFFFADLRAFMEQGQSVGNVLWGASFLVACISLLMELAAFSDAVSAIARNVFVLALLVFAAAVLMQLSVGRAAQKQTESLSAELQQSRSLLALCQIRTHFIFNVLNAISGLCKSDPQQADTELVRFSRYLRGNIDTIQEGALVPFEKELDHVQNYVALEQLRFGEKIMLDEHYETMNFMVLPLLIQPLVENSIKHGLLPAEQGGVIRLSTQTDGDEVIIEIADNGIGFDPRVEFAKSSIGLANVRYRVEQMMGGRMKLESAPGKGTKVKIFLKLEKCGKPGGDASCG